MPTIHTSAMSEGKDLCAPVELVQDKASKTAFPTDQKVGIHVNRQAIKRGLFSRIKEDTYLLAPPIVITNEEMDRTVDILTKSVKAVLG